MILLGHVNDLGVMMLLYYVRQDPCSWRYILKYLGGRVITFEIYFKWIRKENMYIERERKCKGILTISKSRRKLYW